MFLVIYESVYVCVFVYICVLLYYFILYIRYFHVILSSIFVFIQVILFDLQFRVGTLTSIFHMALFKYDRKGTDKGLFMDQSYHLRDRIVCVKCQYGSYFFISTMFLLWRKFGLLQNRLTSLMIFELSISPTKLHPKKFPIPIL